MNQSKDKIEDKEVVFIMMIPLGNLTSLIRIFTLGQLDNEESIKQMREPSRAGTKM